MPTFAEIAGAEVPVGTDGISFLPALFGKKQKNHDYLYWEFHEQGGKVAVRMDNWKAIKLNADKGIQDSVELYDLSVDEGETNDIAASNPEIVDKMIGIMKEAHTTSEIFPFEFEKK